MNLAYAYLVEVAQFDLEWLTSLINDEVEAGCYQYIGAKNLFEKTRLYDTYTLTNRTAKRLFLEGLNLSSIS